MNWYVLRCQARQELITERQIKEFGFEAMCPYAKGQRFIRGSRYVWNWPLFTGYLFAAWAPFSAGWGRLTNEIDGIKAIRGILKREDGEPAVLRPSDVEYIRSIADGKYTSPEDLRSIRAGDQVLVPDLQLDDYSAYVEEMRGREATIEVRKGKNKMKLRIPLAKLRKVCDIG